MSLLNSLLFGLAVSADGFGVGIAYGIKRIRIPVSSLLVICLASMIAVTASMLVGRCIADVIDPVAARWVGAGALVLVGLWFVFDGIRSLYITGKQGLEHDYTVETVDEDDPIMVLHIKPLGVIVQILREPARADFDASGTISYREAFFLGTALALDALGAGMGASMSGLRPMATVAAVGLTKFMLVQSGLLLGARFQRGMIARFAPLVSGGILVFLGFINLRF
ncbi:MAG: sporulation membrane protein YtaF [Solirubrobacterales bacterium]